MNGPWLLVTSPPVRYMSFRRWRRCCWPGARRSWGRGGGRRLSETNRNASAAGFLKTWPAEPLAAGCNSGQHQVTGHCVSQLIPLLSQRFRTVCAHGMARDQWRSHIKTHMPPACPRYIKGARRARGDAHKPCGCAHARGSVARSAAGRHRRTSAWFDYG